MYNFEYLKMVDEFDLIKIDAKKSIHEKQVYFRKLVVSMLKNKGIIVD